jgi:hypothetical protein
MWYQGGLWCSIFKNSNLGQDSALKKWNSWKLTPFGLAKKQLRRVGAQIWLRRLSKTTEIVVLFKGFCD